MEEKRLELEEKKWSEEKEARAEQTRRENEKWDEEKAERRRVAAAEAVRSDRRLVMEEAQAKAHRESQAATTQLALSVVELLKDIKK